MSAADVLLTASRAALLARERAHADDLVRLYGAAYVRLQARMSDLLARASERRQAGQTVSAAWLYRQDRYALLLAQVQAEIDAFSRQADTLIAAQHSLAVQQAVGDAPRLLSASLPPTIPGSFSSLPAPAARRLIGAMGDGRPLAALLSQIAPAAEAVKQALVTGLAAGDNPRQIAAEVRGGMGAGLTRALTISRTSTLTAYRDASLDIYRENEDVVTEWEWHASLSARTCAMCLAMHGRRFPLDVPFGSHPNCRCVPLPVTASWEEGAGGGPPAPQEDSRGPLAGERWFSRQPENTQRCILGPGKLALYQEGSLPLSALVGYRDDPTWGATRWEKSLRSVK